MQRQLENPVRRVVADLAVRRRGSEPGEGRAARADDELTHAEVRIGLTASVLRGEALVW